jgi:hypothetical protein
MVTTGRAVGKEKNGCDSLRRGANSGPLKLEETPDTSRAPGGGAAGRGGVAAGLTVSWDGASSSGK